MPLGLYGAHLPHDAHCIWQDSHVPEPENTPACYSLKRLFLNKKRYRQITCISEQCRREILHHYKLPANDIEIIYNGVDTDAFTPRMRLHYRDAVREKIPCRIRRSPFCCSLVQGLREKVCIIRSRLCP